MRCKSTEPAFCVRFSPDDKVVLATHFDGTVVGYEAATGSNRFEFNITPRDVKIKLPATSAAFRPGGGKPLLAVSCSNGTLDRWELRSLEKVSSIKEEGNEIYAVEYRSDGALFATAGRDAHLRLYDDTTGSIVHNWATVPEGRSNPAAVRLYSIAFPKDDPNLILTGGWGKTIYIYDIRTDEAVGTHQEIFGPYLTGDAMAVAADCILTASHRLDDRIQLWDRATRKATEIPWPTRNEFLPSCAKFSNDAAGEFVAVGGGGSGGDCKEAAFVYDRRTSKLVVDALFERNVNSCAFANRELVVAFADGEGQVHLFEPGKKLPPR